MFHPYYLNWNFNFHLRYPNRPWHRAFLNPLPTPPPWQVFHILFLQIDPNQCNLGTQLISALQRKDP